MPKRKVIDKPERLQLTIEIQPREAGILANIHKEVCPDLSMEPSELINYCLRWIGFRMQEGVLWVPPEPHRKWKDWEIEVLGTRPDHIIASMTGRSEYLIRQKRLDLKIPAYGRTQVDQAFGENDIEDTDSPGEDAGESS